MSRFIIFGPGGFGRELQRAVVHSLRVRGDDREVLFASDSPSVPVIATAAIQPDDEVIIALGDPAARRQVAERIGGREGSLVALSAIVGDRVTIGDGHVICDHSIITCDASIGRQFQCNIYSYVAHDCVIGDFVTFAPRVNCNGNVRIGDGAYIGTGAIIRQGLTIGAGATVGMGAVVTKDVPAGVTVVGNPARVLAR